MRKLISGLLACGALLAQKPIVFPNGVVNAATYANQYPNNLVAPGSIVSIFGTNLASSTASADKFPLPSTLAGTSVTFGGIAAPLFYVSPGQINAQLPGATPTNLSLPPVPVVVTTVAGASDPVGVQGFVQGLGIFMLDSSGCGRGAVFNVAADGTLSLNGPDNSIDPNGILTIFGTGFGPTARTYNGFVLSIPDGEPSPANPLAYSQEPVWASYHSTGAVAAPLYAGRAPGLVGVDQINSVLNNAPEGCSVPFGLASSLSTSQVIPISIHKGGGQCVDPPPTSLAYLKWRKILASSGIDPSPASDTLIIDISSAIIGKQFPPLVSLQGRPGPTCPDFDQDRDLDAGVLTLTGPGLGSIEVRRTTVNGSLRYAPSLPAGSIGAGTYTVNASGGKDVGPFETTVTLPAPIELTSPFPPALQHAPLTITWKGGDPNSTVTAYYVNTIFTWTADAFYTSAPATAGRFTIDLTHQLIGPNTSLWIFQVPNAPPQPFQAQGLTLGGQHTWRYEFLYGQGPLLPE